MKTHRHYALLISGILLGSAQAMSTSEKLKIAHQNFIENRRAAIPTLSDPFGLPTQAIPVWDQNETTFKNRLTWKRNVVATVFWVGEPPSQHNPTTNEKSAWDPNWVESYGGYDSPQLRSHFRPQSFSPQESPFYVALPYNDLNPNGSHKLEAQDVIPWFWNHYRGNGISVCKGRWVAIHTRGRICYAQWQDVGPFETDHWQYVFGDAEPKNNINQSAGIDISPAVRDYLNIQSGTKVEWKFIEDHQVPNGPWRNWNTPNP